MDAIRQQHPPESSRSLSGKPTRNDVCINWMEAFSFHDILETATQAVRAPNASPQLPWEFLSTEQNPITRLLDLQINAQNARKRLDKDRAEGIIMLRMPLVDALVRAHNACRIFLKSSSPHFNAVYTIDGQTLVKTKGNKRLSSMPSMPNPGSVVRTVITTTTREETVTPSKSKSRSRNRNRSNQVSAVGGCRRATL